MSTIAKYFVSGLLITAMMFAFWLPVVNLAEMLGAEINEPLICCCADATAGEKCCDCSPLDGEEESRSCSSTSDDFCQVGQKTVSVNLVLLLGYLPVNYSLTFSNAVSLNYSRQVDAITSGYKETPERPPKTFSIV